MNPNVTFDLPPIGSEALRDPSAPVQNTGMRPGDEKLYVKFYTRSVQDGAASREQGRPIFKDVDYIRIHIPGDKNNVIDTKVTEEYRTRFARQWQQYQHAKVGAEQLPEGTLLSEWPAVTRSLADELRYLHVFTVEQLATLPDGFGTRIMGFYDLRRKAQAYLERAKDEAAAEKDRREKDELRQQVAELKAMLEQLTSPKADTKKEPKRESARSGAGGE